MASFFKSKKLSKSTKSSNESVDWVLDGIVGYLHSPRWNVPVMNFFDDNCLVFENKEENKFEYTDIHNAYKALVESLIACYINELGISEDVFAKACDQHVSSLKSVEKLFEYVWAADDFLLFKNLMIKHNLEIEMQTMRLLQNLDDLGENVVDNSPFNPKFTKLNDSDQSSTDLSQSSNLDVEVMREIIDESQEKFAVLRQKQRELQEQEESDFKRAVEISKREMNKMQSQVAEEQRMLEEAIRLSLELAKQTNQASEESQVNQTPTIPPASIVEDPKIVVAKQIDSPTTTSSFPPDDVTTTIPHNDVAETSSLFDRVTTLPAKSMPTKKITPVLNTLPPLQQKNNLDPSLDWLSQSIQETKSNDADQLDVSLPRSSTSHVSINSAKHSIDPAELAQRKKYLMEQREKLLSLKKQKREEELMRCESNSPDSGKDPLRAQENSSANNDKIMNARRALANRLKREVVMQKK